MLIGDCGHGTPQYCYPTTVPLTALEWSWAVIFIQIRYRLVLVFRKSAADKLGSTYDCNQTFTLPCDYFLNCNAKQIEADLYANN